MARIRSEISEREGPLRIVKGLDAPAAGTGPLVFPFAGFLFALVARMMSPCLNGRVL